jgi:hypothetical protein
MRREKTFSLVGYLAIIVGSLILTGCNTSPTTSNLSKSWSITQTGSIVEIGYGSESDFHQYAALHPESSYFRMNYGPGSGWGTSVVLLPSFWEGGFLYQGAPVMATWKTDGKSLVFSITGIISNLSVQIQLRILPPGQDSISAEVAVYVNGDVELDARPSEAFKLVMLSSMHISQNIWDTQSAYVDSQIFPAPESGWIIEPPMAENRFGLEGRSSVWKNNAPTIEIALDEDRAITGWVTPSNDPNDDNVGFWAASDQIIYSWEYTITSKKKVS